jgi:hypothetical protein
MKESHRGWVEEALAERGQGRQPRWTESIAVGSEGFIEQTKAALGIKAVGREVIGGDGVYELREPVIPYSLDSTYENGDLRQKNTYFWDISA